MTKEEMKAYNRALMDIEEHIDDHMVNQEYASMCTLLSMLREVLNELRYTEEDMECLKK